MKKFIKPESEKKILRTHPIASKTSGWFIKIDEVSNSVFQGEAIDKYGRLISKLGSDPDKLQEEIEDLIKHTS